MSKSPWGNIGAWAAEAEREEQELREQAAKAAAEAASGAPSATGGAESQSYPSLRDAVSKQTKKKTKMSLQEFTMQNVYGSTSSQRGLTHEEMLRLPTGPKERPAGDEMQYGGGRLGGGFSNYGVRSSGPPPARMRDRDSDGEGSWDEEGLEDLMGVLRMIVGGARLKGLEVQILISLLELMKLTIGVQ